MPTLGSDMGFSDASRNAAVPACMLLFLVILTLHGLSAVAETSEVPRQDWRIEVVDIEGDVGRYRTSLAIDSEGTVHVIYYSASQRCLKHAQKEPGGEWMVEVVDNSSWMGREASMAVGPFDDLHVAYTDEKTGCLLYATKPKGREWSIQRLVQDNNSASWPSIAVDGLGTVHIVYFNETSGGLDHAWKAVEGGWSFQRVTSGTVIEPGGTAVTIDDTTTLHVTFSAIMEGNVSWKGLYYANRTQDGRWQIDEEPITLRVGDYLSIAINGTGDVVIAHDTGSRYSDIHLTSPRGSGGPTDQNPFDPTDNTQHPAIAFGPDDRLHVCGYSILMDGLLYNLGPLGWTYLDLEYDAGMYPSIAVDGNGHAHISYYDVNKGDLRYTTNMELPTPPRDFQVEEGDGVLYLTWQPPRDTGSSSLQGYHLFRRDELDKEVKPYKDLGPVLNFTDVDVNNYRRSQYWLTAYNSMGQSASAHAQGEPREMPGPPLNFSAFKGDGYVNLSWRPPDDVGRYTVVGYRIRWATGPPDVYWTIRSWLPSDWTNLSFEADTLQFNHTGLVNGNDYFYRIYAVRSGGEGRYAQTIRIRPNPPAQPPSPPVNLTATMTEVGVRLEWEMPEHDGYARVTRFNIHRGAQFYNISFYAQVDGGFHTDFDWTMHWELPTEFTDGDVDQTGVYYYRLTAVNSEGEGPPSAAVRVPPLPLPSEPLNLEVKAYRDRVILAWDPPASTDGEVVRNYHVYRREFDGNWTLLAVVTSAQEQYIDETLVEDIGYFYAVAAFTDAGEGPLSEKVLTHTTDEEAPSDGTGDDGGHESWTYPIIWIVFIVVVVLIVSRYIVHRKTKSSI